ncbi:MAG TPA: DUF6600 domain-containing protein [Geobacteraceae bacterium]|nr:DUF6600 domain-containing protein [Geobacteraceae bacterium]
MKYLKLLLIVTAGVLLPAISWASPNGFARISLITGDVQIRHADSSDWFPASVNTPLNEGDSIWSPDGARAEVQMQNGSLVRLDSTSSLDILALRDDLVQMHIGMGRAYVRTAAMGGQAMQLDLNESSVQVYDKARIRVDLAGNGDEDISLLKGDAYVESNGRRTTVRAGEMFSVEGGSSEILPLNPPDEWERWNAGRDRVFFARRAAPGYLPDELVAYQSDLDNNGTWARVPEYGYVWRPAVIPGPDWSPYRVGRWVWIGGDYVWVSYETWGWAPYHYGRWVSLPSIGWCWVPPARGDVYWAPGYVGWVSTPQYVGWVPLAPGEKYYGRGYYGRNSINITKVNVQNVTVNKVIYKNVNIVNATTVVNRNSFASGKATYVKPRENIFARADVHFGRPDIKPARMAMMPTVKTVPQAKTPPPAIRNIHFADLRERHPRMVGNLPAAKPGSAGARPDARGARQSNPWAGKPASADTAQVRPPKSGYAVIPGRTAGQPIQNAAKPRTVTNLQDSRAGAGRQQRSASRPEVIEYPAGKPTGGQPQKADTSEKRAWKEVKNPGSDKTPARQNFGNKIDKGNVTNPVSGGETKGFSANDRYKEKQSIPATIQAKSPGGQNQAASAGNTKKPGWSGLPNKGAEQPAAAPPGTRNTSSGVSNAVAKPSAPGAAQRAANPPAGQQQKADKKVWKIRTPENGNGEVKKENKKPEKEHDKP